MSRARTKRTPFKACRKCRLLVMHEEEKCPNCGSTDFTDDWQGVAVIIDPESRIAKTLNIKKPGRYAIKVW